MKDNRDIAYQILEALDDVLPIYYGEPTKALEKPGTYGLRGSEAIKSVLDKHFHENAKEANNDKGLDNGSS